MPLIRRECIVVPRLGAWHLLLQLPYPVCTHDWYDHLQEMSAMLEYLSVGKRICLYLARVGPQQTIDHLVYEISLHLHEEETAPPAAGGGGHVLGSNGQEQQAAPLQFTAVFTQPPPGKCACTYLSIAMDRIPTTLLCALALRRMHICITAADSAYAVNCSANSTSSVASANNSSRRPRSSTIICKLLVGLQQHKLPGIINSSNTQCPVPKQQWRGR